MTVPTEPASAAVPLSLVVFAFDEELNVPTVLPEILAWLERRGAPFELLFVDDGSRDGTRAAALRVLAGRPNAKVLVHERNRGIGAALKTGVRAATLPWVTFLPCDGQIPPGELDALCAAAAASGGSTDGPPIVFSVYRDRDDGLVRKIYSGGIRALMWLLFGVRMTSDGPYLFRRELFDPDALPPDTFFLNFEFPIRVLRDGARHAVVAIHCAPRRAGASKSTGLARILGVARELFELRRRLPVQGKRFGRWAQ
jgi:glycosyltransferase involved in cell wall biosynthesis